MIQRPERQLKYRAMWVVFSIPMLACFAYFQGSQVWTFGVPLVFINLYVTYCFSLFAKESNCLLQYESTGQVDEIFLATVNKMKSTGGIVPSKISASLSLLSLVLITGMACNYRGNDEVVPVLMFIQIGWIFAFLTLSLLYAPWRFITSQKLINSEKLHYVTA